MDTSKRFNVSLQLQSFEKMLHATNKRFTLLVQ